MCMLILAYATFAYRTTHTSYQKIFVRKNDLFDSLNYVFPSMEIKKGK
jgi:hypothetical protein